MERDMSEYDDTIISIDPTSSDYPYLKEGGEYGPNMQHEADCEIIVYECPAQEDKKIFGVMTAKEDFAHIEIAVRSSEFGSVRLFHDEIVTPNSGSKLRSWLSRLDIAPDSHTQNDVVGAKCAVVVKDPRQWEGKWYNGNLVDILGI